MSEWFALYNETGGDIPLTASTTSGLNEQGQAVGRNWQVVLTAGSVPANAVLKVGYLQGVTGTDFADKRLFFDLRVPYPPQDGTIEPGTSERVERAGIGGFTAPRTIPPALEARGILELEGKLGNPAPHVRAVRINMLDLAARGGHAQLIKALSLSVFQRVHIQASYKPAGLPRVNYGAHQVGITGFKHEIMENPRTWYMHVYFSPLTFLQGELAPEEDHAPWIIDDPKSGYLDRDFYVIDAG